MAFVNTNAFEDLIAAVVAERNVWKKRAETQIQPIQRVETGMPQVQLSLNAQERWIYLHGVRHTVSSVEKLDKIVGIFREIHSSLVEKYEDQCSRNNAALENNKQVVAALKDLMARIGIAETYSEVDSKSKARVPPWKTSKAGYLEDLARNAITNDRRDAARRMIEDYVERFNSWEHVVRRALLAEASELAAKEMREKHRINSLTAYARLITNYADGTPISAVLLVDLLLKKVNRDCLTNAYENWVNCEEGDAGDAATAMEHFELMCLEAASKCNGHMRKVILDLQDAVNLVRANFTP